MLHVISPEKIVSLECLSFFTEFVYYCWFNVKRLMHLLFKKTLTLTYELSERPMLQICMRVFTLPVPQVFVQCYTGKGDKFTY